MRYRCDGLSHSGLVFLQLQVRHCTCPHQGLLSGDSLPDLCSVQRCGSLHRWQKGFQGLLQHDRVWRFLLMSLSGGRQRSWLPDKRCRTVAYMIRELQRLGTHKPSSSNRPEQDNKDFNCNQPSLKKLYRHYTKCVQQFTSVWKGIHGLFSNPACFGHCWRYDVVQLFVCKLEGHLRALHPCLGDDDQERDYSGTTFEPFCECGGADDAGYHSTWWHRPLHFYWERQPSHHSSRQFICKK